MKLTNNIREIARTNSQLTQSLSKKLAKLNADPNRFYNGPTNANEDYADSVKIGVIKAVRLG